MTKTTFGKLPVGISMVALLTALSAPAYAQQAAPATTAEPTDPAASDPQTLTTQVQGTQDVQIKRAAPAPCRAKTPRSSSPARCSAIPTPARSRP
ncbi:hypothetical protein P0F65_07165 [Sphingomonas sp. I4]